MDDERRHAKWIHIVILFAFVALALSAEAFVQTRAHVASTKRIERTQAEVRAFQRVDCQHLNQVIGAMNRNMAVANDIERYAFAHLDQLSLSQSPTLRAVLAQNLLDLRASILKLSVLSPEPCPAAAPLPFLPPPPPPSVP